MRLILTFILCTSSPAVCLASTIEGFHESFDGSGRFESSGVQLAGFDNPGWVLDGKGEFAVGSLTLDGNPNGEEIGGSRIYRDVMGKGSFESIIILGDVDAQVSPGSSFTMTLNHHFWPADARHSAGISVSENRSERLECSVIFWSYGKKTLPHSNWRGNVLIWNRI